MCSGVAMRNGVPMQSLITIYSLIVKLVSAKNPILKAISPDPGMWWQCQLAWALKCRNSDMRLAPEFVFCL